MESMNLNGQPYSASLNPTESVGRYTAKTFAWMFAGLMFTFIIALAGYTTGAVLYVFSVPYLYLILGIAELLVVIFLSARIQKMSVGTARVLFFTYAALNGVVFSAYFLIYLTTDLILVFGATSLFFGIMALIGYFTKADFSKLHSFLIGGLVFLMIFWIAAMFINLSQFTTIACTIGVFLFLVLTAYDTQKIRAYHGYYSQDSEMLAKASIFSALQLYLDFINLFLYLLRLLGRNRK